MASFSRTIFFAFISELFFLLLAILVREDKKKMLRVLLVGTFLSGIVGFSSQILGLQTNNGLGTITPESFAPYTQAILPEGNLRPADVTSTTIPQTFAPYTQAALPEITTAPTHRQIASATMNSMPSTNNDTTPEIFVKTYFDAINTRDYDSSWSMLSSKFQGNYTFNEYTSFWDTVDKVEVVSTDIRSQSGSQVLIYVVTHYDYKNGTETTGHTTYKLIKDRNSWLFDPN